MKLTDVLKQPVYDLIVLRFFELVKDSRFISIKMTDMKLAGHFNVAEKNSYFHTKLISLRRTTILRT